jgi:hypothetical protein
MRASSNRRRSLLESAVHLVWRDIRPTTTQQHYQAKHLVYVGFLTNDIIF